MGDAGTLEEETLASLWGLGSNQQTLYWSVGAHSRERVFTLSTGGTQIYMLIVL